MGKFVSVTLFILGKLLNACSLRHHIGVTGLSLVLWIKRFQMVLFVYRDFTLVNVVVPQLNITSSSLEILLPFHQVKC